IVKAAVEADIIRKNPCTGIVIKIDNGALKKDVLSIEEIQKLITTHYAGENTDIRRAFIFCLYTGLRWCDVKDLTFANVDFANRRLHFDQAKTKGHSAASNVVIPLNDGHFKLIGEPSEKGKRDEIIFPLPSHNMCLKALRHWTARAGIEKHITWHCARHSFAVNILNNGANIKTVASLLGHSGLKHTEKYTRAVDSLKEAAINSLPELEL
ncbi:MAG: site-specific integrase, partial [Muribaculaceae bacterium]|nr:site-specific integrase [Muribaculaceae bacterium]